MSKSIKGTQTEKNLMTSFAGESQARMRYTYFASAAKKEGYEQIAAIFTETADQEKEHAKRMFKYLEGGMVEITASYPAGVIGKTLDNLRAAAAGEHEEWAADYPRFADVAEAEGFPEIAAMYRNIAVAEKGHEERYLSFVKGDGAKRRLPCKRPERKESKAIWNHTQALQRSTTSLWIMYPMKPGRIFCRKSCKKKESETAWCWIWDVAPEA